MSFVTTGQAKYQTCLINDNLSHKLSNASCVQGTKYFAHKFLLKHMCRPCPKKIAQERLIARAKCVARATIKGASNVFK